MSLLQLESRDGFCCIVKQNIRGVMKNIDKGIYLVGLAFLAGGHLVQSMEPIEKSRAYVFKVTKADKMSYAKLEAMRRVLHTMITDLPVLRPGRIQERNTYVAAYKSQLKAISALIQTPLFDPGTIIAELIARQGLGNILYDIAQENNYQATMNWLTKQGLVNFVIVIENDTDYGINVPGVARVVRNKLSQQISINNVQFPMVFQGYGDLWGKFITEQRLDRGQLIRGIADLKLPSSAIVKISINLTGNVPPYDIKFSYSPLKKEELKAKNLIKSNDPLDLFDLVVHHKLTASSRSLWGSYLTATEILSWPDVGRQQDPILNDVVLTKIPSGRYTRRDVYRYLLNLTKDNYTVQDIQKSFDLLVQEMGNKYVLGWSEYVTAHGLVAGPFAWLTMLSKAPINKDTVISVALSLLKKAYRNLMMDKGVVVPE